MSRFRFSQTAIPGVVVAERQRIGDSRGFLSRFFCEEEFASAGFDSSIAQINHTLTRRKGAVRGMHFQNAPHSEDKLVSVLRGEVFDVAVDLRRGSPTFLQWHAEVLSAENARSLLIPKGFAHGFQTLSEDCELLYLHSHRYVPEAEGGLRADDPALAISWPLPFSERSERDSRHSLITPDFTGLQP